MFFVVSLFVMSEMMLHILDECLGEPRRHNESTGQIAYDCPECSAEKDMPQGDGKGKMEVNYHKDVYKCWVCNQVNDTHGSIKKLIRKYGNDSLLEEYKLFKPEKFDTEKDKASVDKLPEGYTPLWEMPEEYDHEFNKALTYLAKRGIGRNIIEKYEIGFTTVGKYKNRIIIPSRDHVGNINYFVTRAYGFNKLKYLNPDADKTVLIFNEDKISWDSTIYLVEGTFDHIVTPNSIPLLGKYINDNLYNKLQTKACANVVILLDDDAWYDAVELYKMLNRENLYGRVRIIKMPKGYDMSEVHENYGVVGTRKILSRRERLKEPIITKTY